MKEKIIIPLLCFSLVVGILSGCTTTNKAPTASFTYAPTTKIYIGTEITFTDASTDTDGTIASWSWDFGDTTNATAQNPTHTYTALGAYTVTLVVTDNSGTASNPYSMTVTVTNVPPTASFGRTPLINITVGQTISFADTSTKGDANITSWLWNFGDDTNSTLQNPMHNYTAAGNYSVTLKVTDANNLSDTTAAVTIEVKEA